MRTLGIVAAMVAGLTLTACGSSGGGGSPTGSRSATSSSSSPSFDRAAAEAAVKRNWEAFFADTTPVAKKVDYLQHGESLEAAVQRFGADPRTKQASAKVTGVVVNSPASATVKYQVLLNGTVALPDAVGTAVYEDGTWKVSDTTLCGLLGLLGGGKIPGC